MFRARDISYKRTFRIRVYYSDSWYQAGMVSYPGDDQKRIVTPGDAAKLGLIILL